MSTVSEYNAINTRHNIGRFENVLRHHKRQRLETTVGASETPTNITFDTLSADNRRPTFHGSFRNAAAKRANGAYTYLFVVVGLCAPVDVPLVMFDHFVQFLHVGAHIRTRVCVCVCARAQNHIVITRAQ